SDWSAGAVSISWNRTDRSSSSIVFTTARRSFPVLPRHCAAIRPEPCTCTVSWVSPIRPSQTGLPSSIIASVVAFRSVREKFETSVRPAGGELQPRVALGGGRGAVGPVPQHSEDRVHLGVAHGVGARAAAGRRE